MKTYIKIIKFLGIALFWTTKFQVWVLMKTASLTEYLTKKLIDLEDKQNVH